MQLGVSEPLHCLSSSFLLWEEVDECGTSRDDGTRFSPKTSCPSSPLTQLSSVVSVSHLSPGGRRRSPPPAAFCCITSESSSLSRLAPECALLHSESFDVSGNSWLREIWWKVLRPVFTPSQMALNKLGGEDTNTLFSEGLNLEDCFGRFRCCMVVLGTFQT